MPRVLVISPRFPPTSAPDLHRVRVSLPYLSEFGWEPIVLCVNPAYVEEKSEPLLLETIPADTLTRRVRALPARWTRKLGLGDLSLRALPFLYAAGLKIIRQHEVDLVYFSTTAFPSMSLGRVWRKQTGVPFVLDMQDPWLSDYYEKKPERTRPPKYWFSHRLHSMLEPWTMKKVDGLVAVSQDYISTLEGRYPWLRRKPRITLPFGGSELDFDIVRNHPQPNRFFKPKKDLIHGVYVGRGGADMRPALQIIFQALRMGLERDPALFSKLRLYFIGTDYAPDDRARETIAPVAEACNVGEFVTEHASRVPYFEALQLLSDADFLIVPGSDDPQYTASKIYPYIMARKPMLAVFHEQSSVCKVLRDTGAASVMQFASGESADSYAQPLLETWSELLLNLPFQPQTKWEAFAPYTAREMTRRQCGLFDQVINVGKSTRYQPNIQVQPTKM